MTLPLVPLNHLGFIEGTTMRLVNLRGLIREYPLQKKLQDESVVQKY